MTTNFIHVALMYLVTILIAFIAAGLLTQFINQNNQKGYDERQVQIRYIANTASLILIILAELFVSILDLRKITIPISLFYTQIGILSIAAFINFNYKLWKNALWGIATDRKKHLLVLIIMGLGEIASPFFHIIDQHSVEEKICMTLFGILILLLAIEEFIKIKLDEREEE